MLHLFPSKWEGGQNALSKLQKWQNKCINNCTKTSRTCCTSCTWYFICAKSNMRIIYFGVMVQHSFWCDQRLQYFRRSVSYLEWGHNPDMCPSVSILL